MYLESTSIGERAMERESTSNSERAMFIESTNHMERYLKGQYDRNGSRSCKSSI
jgi:hypothetical protein